ncbi:MFS transporter [Pseudonocardia sp. CA-107938]|uniref:MFS transporter n=1 Tax=Pseudonocardia sp. CA-107938 TaxID=3240021 RepID=UPI003D8C1D53
MTDTTVLPHRGRWAGLVALLLAESMNVLDTTVVQVAAPTVRAELGASDATLPWLTAAYTLPFAVLLVSGGRLGDAWGRRRLFVGGVVGFALASAACACAPSVALLLAARAVQGVAAAAIVPQTFGLIRAMFDGRELPRALGWIGPVMGLTAVFGPPLGGLLTAADVAGLSWRAVFLVNLPLAAVVLALTRRLREDRAGTRPGFDLPGTLVAVLALGLLTYPLIDGTATTRPMLLVGAAALGGLVLVQRAAARAGRPTLVEVALFRRLAFPCALLTSTTFFAAVNGTVFVVVLHLQLHAGADAGTAGLALLPWSVGSAVASLVSGRVLVARFGPRTMLAGLAVLVAGLATASGLSVVALALGGIGMGLFTVPFFTAALGQVAPQETGSAAGLLNAVQQFGTTFGVALLGGLYLADGSLGRALVAALVLTAAAAGTALVLVRSRRS